MEFVINGKQIDIRKVVPLTQGDLEDLEDAGIPFGQQLTSKQINTMLMLLLRKVDSSITRDDVRTLTTKQAADISETIRKFSEAASD